MKHLISLAMLGLMTGSAPAQTIRVGVFNKPTVVVAYYQSPIWAETMKAKRAEQQEAKKANDPKKLEELEKWGQAHQERAHQQLAGEASIDDIVAALAPALPEIANKAKVSIIATDLPYAGPSVEKLDVTDLLVDWLKANGRRQP